MSAKPPSAKPPIRGIRGTLPWDSTTLNVAALTAAHVAVTQAEAEHRAAGRVVSADALAYADLIVLMARDALSNGAKPPIRGMEEEAQLARSLPSGDT